MVLQVSQSTGDSEEGELTQFMLSFHCHNAFTHPNSLDQCDLLIKVVEREMEEFRKEEELEEQKKEELALKEAAEIPKVEESAGTAGVANPLVAVGDGVEPMAVEQQPVAAAAVDPAPAAADVIAE